MLHIDGSRGEGGGQVLRTCLSLAALTKRPFRLTRIRAGRKKPGLRPQHLTAVRAVADLCRAQVGGAKINATTLEFYPAASPRGGSYTFDVSDAAQGGSAGSVSLVFQAVIWPLLFADGPAQLTLRGGTHVPFSPPFHYVAEVAQPAFARLGATFALSLRAWGWFPAGGGEISADITPVSRLRAVDFAPVPAERVFGVSAVTNLPAHIPNRMARRSHNLLQQRGLPAKIEEIRARGAGPGAGLVLWVPGAGCTSLGRKGLPADKVAETAVAQLAAFVDNRAAVDRYLADQLLLPLALAQGQGSYTTDTLTQHTLTNADLLRHWLGVDIDIRGDLGAAARVTVTGINLTRA